MSNWYEYVGSFIAGGALLKIFDFIRNTKKDKINEFELLLNIYKTELDTQRAEYNVVRAELDQYKDKVNIEIVQLRNKVELLESAHQDLPLPMWLKDSNGIMMALNSEYEETFLIPNGKSKDDYIGKTDFDVWDKTTATIFNNHDKMVFRTGKKFDGVEEVPDINGDKHKWRIIKYVRYSGRTKIGIAGIALPLND